MLENLTFMREWSDNWYSSVHNPIIRLCHNRMPKSMIQASVVVKLHITCLQATERAMETF